MNLPRTLLFSTAATLTLASASMAQVIMTPDEYEASGELYNFSGYVRCKGALCIKWDNGNLVNAVVYGGLSADECRSYRALSRSLTSSAKYPGGRGECSPPLPDYTPLPLGR
jgi:hypothetical protein